MSNPKKPNLEKSSPEKSNPEKLLNGQTVIEAVAESEPELIHIAVGFAGRLLSDLGAHVIRVVPERDLLVRLRTSADEQLGDSSVLATYLNRNKVLLNVEEIGSVEGEAIQLVLTGSEGDTFPAASRVCASAIANSSALDSANVSELGIQGLVGLTDLFGEPGEQPLAMGGHQTAYATGYAIFCAAMASLTKLKFRGETDTANVNSVDALAWVNWKGFAAGALGFPIRRAGKNADAPVVKCADGYFAFMHMPNNWEDVKAELSDPRLDDEHFAKPGRRSKNAGALNEILAEWAADKPWLYLYDFCQQHAIPGGPILGGSELLQDPLYLHRNYFTSTPHLVEGEEKDVQVPGLPMTVEDVAEDAIGEASKAARFSDNTPTDLPLSGKLVLDLGIFTAGSVTSTLLADLGATVIKVESESYSDPFRIWPGMKGDSPFFTFNNRNKLGLNLDLKTEDGHSQFLELVKRADIVVENFRRGVLGRLGIDYPVLKAANPKIVLASISGQGASGPGSGHVSFGSTLEAIGGVAAMTGYPGEGCYISGRNLNYPDQIVCLYGAGAVMAALMKVEETGRGMHIDVSQREVTTLAVGEVVAAASLLGGQDDFPGNKNLNAYLQDIYPSSDGWLCVTLANEVCAGEVARLLDCELSELEARFVDWLADQTSHAAIEMLRPLGIAVFKANTGAEAAEEPSIKAGHAFTETASGQMVKGFPFQFKNNPLTIYEESPAMGEHTDQITELLSG